MSAPALKAERLRVNRFLPYGRQVIEEDDIAAVAEAKQRRPGRLHRIKSGEKLGVVNGVSAKIEAQLKPKQ